MCDQEIQKFCLPQTVETGQKDANNKKIHNYSKLLKIQAILSTHGLVILPKFHNDRAKIANLLLVL